jgi:predicted RNA binding protein YcfA (HicA-like mRNA interferase family)
MPRLPRLRGREVIAALRRAGFSVLRVRGSHHFVQHPDGRRTTLPRITSLQRRPREESRQEENVLGKFGFVEKAQ